MIEDQIVQLDALIGGPEVWCQTRGAPLVLDALLSGGYGVGGQGWAAGDVGGGEGLLPLAEALEAGGGRSEAVVEGSEGVDARYVGLDCSVLTLIIST